MMSTAESPITEHLDTWTSAIKAKSSAGRGGGKKQELYGVKKLRDLILELAVRGLLVPQDANDEPASRIAEKIANERSKLIKQGKLKKQKALLRISKVNAPFAIPSNWDWIRLGNATNYGVCDKAEASDVDEDTWVLELEDVEKSTSRLRSKVRFNERNFRSSKNRFSRGDVIYGKLRPYLDKVIVADEPGVCTTEMIPISVYAALEPKFLRLALKAPYFIRYANDSTHGMNLPRMGTDKARDALVPIAPEKEQHRIVVKVDELMALCDQLERQQEDSARTHGTLVQTLLGALTAARKRGQFPQAWQRIESHFDTVFTTESSIDQLKQTILQLAVMGKLVEQYSNDEPASQLLKKINGEKNSLIKSGGLKKQNPSLPISADEAPFELPALWEWCRFGLLFKSFNNGLYKKAGFYTDEGVISLRMYNIQDGKIDFSDVRRVDVDESELDQFALEAGDLLINRVNSKELVGKTALIPHFKESLVFESMNMRARPHLNLVSPEYLNLYMRTRLAREAVFAFAKEAVGQASINQSQVGSLLTPLPPQAEQHRIVAKVEELMTLCERIKARLQSAQATQLCLADGLVDAAIQ